MNSAAVPRSEMQSVQAYFMLNLRHLFKGQSDDSDRHIELFFKSRFDDPQKHKQIYYLFL